MIIYFTLLKCSKKPKKLTTNCLFGQVQIISTTHGICYAIFIWTINMNSLSK